MIYEYIHQWYNGTCEKKARAWQARLLALRPPAAALHQLPRQLPQLCHQAAAHPHLPPAHPSSTWGPASGRAASRPGGHVHVEGGEPH